MKNFTCHYMFEQKPEWSLETMGLFAPVLNTSIRGTNDQRGVSGHR
jgi:hypothetical protein